MESELVGTLARLPDGQQVRIEIIYDDGFAKVRWADGEWMGKVAVCAIEKLEPVTERCARRARGTSCSG